MRKHSALIAGGALVALIAGAPAVQAANMPTMSKFQQVSQIVQDKCLSCHTRNFDLPFYAKFPGVKDIIEKDFRDGLRAMDLNQELVQQAKDKPAGEVTISKMEWVINNDTMPPAKFTAVHWGSRLTSADREAILAWVKATRAMHYATGLAAPDKANEPLQPLPATLPVNAKKVALGEKLYNDKRISGDDTVACVSCHGLDKGGVDNKRFAEGVRKQQGDINAPTVFNSVFNVRQFWNGRAADLQEQAGGPPLNPIEMASRDWKQICAKLEADAALTAEFTAVYPSGWSDKNITDAIGEYEKTLITPNSRFDRWLMGKNALTETEMRGYERFKAYRCASCHTGKAVGGQSFEYMDLKKPYFTDRGNPLGSDEGLKGFTKQEQDLHKFKVPTLRNVELTGPYLHDGTVQTLDEAVRIMGDYLAGISIPQTDRNDIVTFLRALTGEFQGKKLTGQVAPK